MLSLDPKDCDLAKTRKPIATPAPTAADPPTYLTAQCLYAQHE